MLIISPSSILQSSRRVETFLNVFYLFSTAVSTAPTCQKFHRPSKHIFENMTESSGSGNFVSKVCLVFSFPFAILCTYWCYAILSWLIHLLSVMPAAISHHTDTKMCPSHRPACSPSWSLLYVAAPQLDPQGLPWGCTSPGMPFFSSSHGTLHSLG